MLEVDSVTLTFGDRKILSGCYLNCNQGEIVGLLGRNGSGKSCLMQIILGSLRADFSHLRIDGKIVSNAYRSNRVTYLSQDPFLPRFLSVNKILEKFQKDNANALDQEIVNNLSGHRLENLSGGELRLVELIWILNLKTSYILLDEPFSGISPIYIEIMQKLIIEAGKTKGIILTDHMYRPLLEISNRIVLLHNNAVYSVKEEVDLIRYNYIPGFL